ncbi:MAG: GGDEF domain-containing protein, partial [Mycobacterium sp.]|nr:GGDEF domain-containing protein [Mycobacterium sp.]
DLLARSRARAVTVTVVAVDIDNFKQINDAEGHLAGDEHLIRCATCWRDLAPRDAVLARLGGDEFAFCIVDHSPGAAPATAERFIADLRRHTPDTSVGIASQRGEGADIVALHAAADASLYAAKRTRLARHASG